MRSSLCKYFFISKPELSKQFQPNCNKFKFQQNAIYSMNKWFSKAINFDCK